MKSILSNELRYAPSVTTIKTASKFAGVGVIQTPSAPRLCALVGPTLIVCATHYSTGNYAIPAGTEVKFWIEPNRAVIGVIREFFSSSKDVTVYRLYSPVAEIIPFDLATVDQVRSGKNFIFTGISDVKTDPRPIYAEGSPTALMSVTSGMAKFRQTPAATMQAGDSGAPDFVYDGAGLRLIGPHAAAALTNWTTSIINYFV